METVLSVRATDSKGQLQELVGRISGISTLPATVVRIMEVVNNASAGAAQLKAVIECDPALTARILKTANSAYLGLRTKVSNLQHAVSLLGFNAVRNLAVTASVSDIFKQESDIANYSRLGLWRHMLSVALSSRMIARRLRHPQFEEAFLGGLLHDLGVVLFDEHAHEDFRTALSRVRPDRELHLCEKDVFGFDHAELGSTLAEQWRFPDFIVQRIRYHHAPHECGPQDQVMVSVIALADFLCHQKGLSAVSVKYQPRLRSDVLATLGLTRNDVRVLWEDMDQEISAARELFGL